MVFGEQGKGSLPLDLLACCAALSLLPLAAPVQAGGLAPPIEPVEVQAEGAEAPAGETSTSLSTSSVTLDEPLTDEEPLSERTCSHRSSWMFSQVLRRRSKLSQHS